MQFLKIVFACVAAAIFYGIVHDQITARICVEYFTRFHPPVFDTQSPTLLGLGWGVIATWWAGAIIGILLAFAARAGARNKLTIRQLLPRIACLMLAMALCAIIAGGVGYLYGNMPPRLDSLIDEPMRRRFLACWWAHNASYASGFLGGLVVCSISVVKRIRGLPATLPAARH